MWKSENEVKWKSVTSQRFQKKSSTNKKTVMEIMVFSQRYIHLGEKQRQKLKALETTTSKI